MSRVIRRNYRPVTRFDRIFDEFWRNEFQNGEFALALDVDESDSAYTVTAALPGVNAEDINIRLNDDVLTISAEVNERKNGENGRRVIQERRYGKFSRSLRLPVPVNADAIEANYENGVLTLHVPKAEEAQPRQIPVKVASK
jgi:HSP20 family protein